MKISVFTMTWFDLLLAGLLIFGFLRGRKRGMSEELLDVFQWLTIIVVAAMLYEPVGKLNRPVSRPPLTKCPLCRKPVRKIISSVNSPTHLKPLSVSDAKKAGFTIFKKVGQGEYERQ